MALDKEQVLTMVTHLLRESAGHESDEVAEHQTEALDYYFMRPRGDEVAGRSAVVSGDLSAMVEANLAQAMDAFTGTNVAAFDGDSADDDVQAELESDVVTHYVWKANPGFMTFLSGIKDALLLRNAINKVWVSEHRRSETVNYENLEPDAFTELTTAPGQESEVKEYDAVAKTATIKQTVLNRRLLVEGVPVENFRYTKNWTSLDLQMIPFCGERHVDARSYMLDLGFDKKIVKDLPAFVTSTEPGDARNPRSTQTATQPNADPSRDLIEWYEAYVLIDEDGDGLSERRRIDFVSNEKILSDETVPGVPYAAGSALVNPHRFLGVSLFDKLKQVQDIGTGLTRALLDNANATNKSRTASLENRVNSEDLADGSVNSNIRVKSSVGDVRSAIMPLTVPDISAGINMNIQGNKVTRAELGGAALDLASAGAQLSDRVGSQGVDRMYSVMEQLASMMTKTLAESLIRNTYLLVHSTLRGSFDQPVSIKRRGKWQEMVPANWPERVTLTVKPGMSPGERQRKVSALEKTLDNQVALAKEGMTGVIVNAAGLYRALMDWGRASEQENPEQYWIDPDSDAAKQALAQQQEKSARQEQEQKSLMNLALGLEQLRVSLKKRNDEAQLQFNYYKANLDSEVAEMNVVGKATADLEKLQREAELAAEADDADRAALDSISSAIGELKSMSNGADAG